MVSDGNCKYLPMFNLSYVKICFRLWFMIVAYYINYYVTALW